MFLNAAYDKKRQPVLGNVNANAPDETQPWTICITQQADAVPLHLGLRAGRIYKMTLDGKILGMLGESGRGPDSSTGFMASPVRQRTSCLSRT